MLFLLIFNSLLASIAGFMPSQLTIFQVTKKGKLNELKENQVQNSAQEAKMIAMENNNNNGYGYNNMKNTPVKNNGDRDVKEAISLLDNYSKRYNRNEISYEQINSLYKKFGKKLGDIINKLIINNKLIDNDNGYEIML